MYSFTNQEGVGLPGYPHFADVLEIIKKRPGMRMMLDGQAGLACLCPEDSHAHRGRHALWEHLRRNHPHEYQRQAREHGKKNSEALLALLRIHDPLFHTTWSMLEHMLDMLPDSAEHLVKKGTHDNPAMFMELYGEMREWAEEVEHRKHRRSRAKHEPGEKGRITSAGESESRRKADLAALVAKVKSGRAEEGDLMRYLELAMRREDGGYDDEGGK